MPGGRPSKYSPEMVERYALLASRGLVDDEIALVLGVAKSTLSKWVTDYPEFSEARKKAKAIADEAVERALFERATGYEHPEDKIFQYEGEPVIVPTVKHYPPDPVAAIFWLKNRKPKEWRDKQEVQVDASVEIKHTFDPEGV